MTYYYFLLLLIPCIMLSLWASVRVKTTFRTYQNVANRSRMTGYDTAALLLRNNGVTDVRVGRISGELSDHFDPSKKLVNLSQATYGSASVGAVAVAAHEIGHVMQKEKGYLPYKIRSALVPVTNIGSRLSFPVVIVGLLIMLFSYSPIGEYFVYAGVGLYGLSTLFMLATLPVEFDASRRANKMLVAEGILTQEESYGAKRVLSAAALTYVASLLVSLVYFLRFLFIVLSLMGRRR